MRLLEEYDKFVKEAEASAAQPQVSQPEKKSFAERAATITQVNTESVNALWKSIKEEDLQTINAHIKTSPNDDFFEIASNPDITLIKVSRDKKSKYFIAFTAANKMIAHGAYSTIYYTAPLLETNTGYYALPSEPNSNTLSQAKIETYQFQNTKEVTDSFKSVSAEEVIQKLQACDAALSKGKFTDFCAAKINEEARLCEFRDEGYHGKLLKIDHEKLIVTRIDVLPLFPGLDLFEAADIIQESCFKEQVMIAVSIINELIFLHVDKKSIHGDFKGENLIVEPKTLNVKAVDLAYTKKIGGQGPKASMTRPHAAPEVVKTGESSVEGDIYGLAVTLIDLFYGPARRPSKEDGSLEFDEEDKLVEDAWDEIEIRELLARGIAFNPEERPKLEDFSSFFKELLEDLLDHEAKQNYEEEQSYEAVPKLKRSSSMLGLNIYAERTSYELAVDTPEDDASEEYASEENSEFSPEISRK